MDDLIRNALDEIFQEIVSGREPNIQNPEPGNDDDAAHLIPNSSNTEAQAKSNRGTAKIDFLANGFKIRSDGSLLNGTGTMIYMAFAEAPFVNSNGVPANAR